jgi:hypothetical protein
MSRTEEDILSRVDITIMRDSTFRTYPGSYSEVCDTLRPRLACARRTDTGRKRFIHFLVPSPVRSRFVAEHVAKGRPAGIKHGLRQAGLGESGGVHIAHRDVIEFAKPAALIGYTRSWFRMRQLRSSINKPQVMEQYVLPGLNAGVSLPENP